MGRRSLSSWRLLPRHCPQGLPRHAVTPFINRAPPHPKTRTVAAFRIGPSARGSDLTASLGWACSTFALCRIVERIPDQSLVSKAGPCCVAFTKLRTHFLGPILQKTTDYHPTYGG